MESKKDFLSYISKCIKQQGSYAAAALAPLLNKLVEKVFKNTEDLEKLAASGANGGDIPQFVAHIKYESPAMYTEDTGMTAYRLKNTQDEINTFLDEMRSRPNIVPMVYFEAYGRTRMTDVWLDSREFGEKETEEFLITRESDGEPLVSVCLNRNPELSGIVFYEYTIKHKKKK